MNVYVYVVYVWDDWVHGLGGIDRLGVGRLWVVLSVALIHVVLVCIRCIE